MTSYRYIRRFAEVGIEDVPLVGGKNASLGEMYRELTGTGIRVPNGFAILASAYREVLDAAGAWPRLRALLDGIDPADVTTLAGRAAEARAIVREAPIPADMANEIRQAYEELVAEYEPSLSVAVRSSATAEDLPTASFAGQHESYLNVTAGDLVETVRRCFASIFTDRAIRYRIDNGFDHFKVFNSVGIMKMVRADRATSGVLFSLDTETGFPDVVFITAAYGLGETIVQGAVDPDEFYVFKPTYRDGRRCVLRRTLGGKAIRMVYGEAGSHELTHILDTSQEERARFCLTDAEVLELAGTGIAIEEHYSAKAGEHRPMDVEFAKDALDGKLYIIQARPETAASRIDRVRLDDYRLTEQGKLRLDGRAVGKKIASGLVRVVHSPSDLAAFVPGEVLVAATTSPDWGTVMKSAGAIITDKGGRTCHAAIVARELGIPAVVGTGEATKRLSTGDLVTVSCAEGDTGRVYEGALRYAVERVDLSRLARPRTQIMLNVGDPDSAFALSVLPNDGVGLARMEFIISNAIKVHPMALVHPEKVSDPTVRAEIIRIAAGYSEPSHFFVERLSEGIGTIAAAFYPKPVIVRLSDFKTNEYADLVGGRDFEPVEANPMLGFRGASRYAHPAYAEGFALECAALKRARNDMGLTNIRVMVPFCRRVGEAERVLAKMAECGLSRGQDGLEIFVMCEIPNNVILIDQFARHFDGFSIGSNDLTQLTLGVDRDSDIVAFDFDERDAGVKEMIRLAVEGCRRNRRHSGICGQAPSDYPEMAEYLVRLGIDSISLNPDSVVDTTRRILAIEEQLPKATFGRLEPAA
jgi:pyruvate,water dikinase